MSYRIEYQQVKKVRGMEKRISRAAAMTALFFLLFVLLTGCLWPQGAEAIRSAIIPGDPAITTAALADFTLALKNGTPLSSAFSCFCDQIFQGAEIDLG